MRWAKRNIRLRSRLRAAGLLPDASRTALNTLRWADALIWNPAGEIHPGGRSDEVFLILLMVRLVQRHGKPVAIVNHSLEGVDPVLNRLLVHVYTGAQFVAVREPVHFRKAGFRTGKLPAKAVDLVKKCEGIVGSGLTPIVVPGCHKSA
jgi:polysaccharide pyruvyl transferase WcaK-like protein